MALSRNVATLAINVLHNFGVLHLATRVIAKGEVVYTSRVQSQLRESNSFLLCVFHLRVWQVEDFSVLCPQGWTRSENNNCHAPVTYAGLSDTYGVFAPPLRVTVGPCGFTIAPESYTPRMKEVVFRFIACTQFLS